MKSPLLLVCIAALIASTAMAQTKMGTIGDSLIDEHFEQFEFGTNLGYSKNALELMVTSGRVDSGPIGNWGGTRGAGYAYNWALAGATTGSLLAQNQHTNLASQIASEAITTAVMVVGANDLFPFPPTGLPSSSYEAIYEGLATQDQIDAIANQAVASVVLAAQTLKHTGVQLVVATAPDYGISPFAKTFYTDPIKRARVDDVVEFWNSEAVDRLTNTVNVPVVDIYGFSKDIWGDHGSEHAIFTLGGVDLDLVGTGGVDYTSVLHGTYNPNDVTSDTVDAFVHDGIHPNSTISGLFANLFMTAFNQEHGNSFTLFTEQEILTNAGPGLGAMYTGDTLDSSLGGKSYSDYIFSAGLPGDYNNDNLVNAADYTTWRDALGQTGIGLAADGDSSGEVDAGDYDIWKTHFGAMATPVSLTRADSPAVSEPTAVPEPSATLLMMLGILGMAAAGRHRYVCARSHRS